MSQTRNVGLLAKQCALAAEAGTSRSPPVQRDKESVLDLVALAIGEVAETSGESGFGASEGSMFRMEPVRADARWRGAGGA